MEYETACQRARKDFSTIFHNSFTFKLFSILPTGLGTIISTDLAPANISTTWRITYGVIGGFIGLISLWFVVFMIQLLSAPYRQRNEIRTEYSKVQSERVSKKQINDIKLGIEKLIFEGTDVLKAFKSVLTFGDYWPKEEFKAWREKGTELLYYYKLNVYSSLWFKDTSSVDISEAHNIADYIQACESGLARLEELLIKLHED